MNRAYYVLYEDENDIEHEGTLNVVLTSEGVVMDILNIEDGEVVATYSATAQELADLCH